MNPETYAVLHARLAQYLVTLPDKPEETVESTLHALWHTAAGSPRSAVAAMRDAPPPLPPGPRTDAVVALVNRRLAGEPLAHLTGRQHFMGLEMLSAPQALIPRVETEMLGYAALELLPPAGGADAPLAIDVCTGSGNLAYAIARHRPDVRMHATDLSAEAVAFARRNGAHLGLAGRVQFRTGDLLEPFLEPAFAGRTDLVICAPPYIHSAKVERMAEEISQHEPRLAFDGGPLGVTLLMRLFEEAPRLLRDGGWLAVEVGAGQGPALARRLQRDTTYAEIRPRADAGGEIRVILARKAGA
ncbi:peptide chain release factor N(5)-glutamine methyltransferase [Metallibacterium sp.]|uniref:N5-glutamine methyltransferase family protein n=1 Tax=Metallibacterium sp. TaxID=2940281 RepID=UPI002611A019|nr:peptide chain release factor N(5)-glutamine methyltransferase [Metallibacterium sp.]